MTRRLLTVALACLCLMTYGNSCAATVGWIALSEAGGAHADVANTLIRELERQHPGKLSWVVAPWHELAQQTPSPAYVVAVGTAAWLGAASRFTHLPDPPLLLATLLPRAAFERGLGSVSRQKKFSAIFLDQPPSRQAQLARLALPAARTVGLLLGPESKLHVPRLRQALRDEGFTVIEEEGASPGMSAGVQALLEQSEFILAIPDSTIFNSQTIAGILSAGYRRRVPLIGFSPAYVKAGALAAVYSTPTQVGRSAAAALAEVLAGRALPEPHAGSEFTVSVNQDVARALGLTLDEPALNTGLR